MSETESGAGQKPAAVATVKSRSRFNFIWAIPIIAVLVAGFLGYRTLSERGPEITITFTSGDGLEAGKTPIRHKSVQLGTVETVQLTRDLKKVVVTARMTKEAEHYLSDKTRFWVVRPRISAGGISGLETLVSGAYIAMAPEPGKDARDFVGLETPPVIVSDVPGTTFLLKTSKLGSLSSGSPIFFRGLDVGQVLGYKFSEETEEITIHAFVRKPYDQLVFGETRFWNASGVSVSMGPSGLDVQVESLEAVLAGGVAFETTAASRRGASPAADGSTFKLYDNREQAKNSEFTNVATFVSMFSSVKGIAAGADVELRGMKIGQVTSVSLELDAASNQVWIPVVYEIQLQRIRFADGSQPSRSHELMKELVRRGLRAQLQMGNILTGSQIVSLDFEEDAKPAELLTGDRRYPVVPTTDSDFQSITQSIETTMKKIASLPLEQTVGDLRNTLQSLNDILKSKQVSESLTNLNLALSAIEQTATTTNQELGPLLKQLTNVSEGVDKLLAQAEGSVVSGDSLLQRDLRSTLQEVREAARSFRVLTNYLEEHPEALIRGKAE